MTIHSKFYLLSYIEDYIFYGRLLVTANVTLSPQAELSKKKYNEIIKNYE